MSRRPFFALSGDILRAMGFPTVHEDELDGEGLELPTRFRAGEPGARPGIDLAELETMPIPEVRVPITCIDYAPDRVETRHITDKDFEEFIKSRRAPWVKVRWINVDGLNDPAAIRALAIKYGFHPSPSKTSCRPVRGRSSRATPRKADAPRTSSSSCG